MPPHGEQQPQETAPHAGSTSSEPGPISVPPAAEGLVTSGAGAPGDPPGKRRTPLQPLERSRIPHLQLPAAPGTCPAPPPMALGSAQPGSVLLSRPRPRAHGAVFQSRVQGVSLDLIDDASRGQQIQPVDCGSTDAAQQVTPRSHSRQGRAPGAAPRAAVTPAAFPSGGLHARQSEHQGLSHHRWHLLQPEVTPETLGTWHGLS